MIQTDSASVQKSYENDAHISCKQPEGIATTQPEYVLDCVRLSNMALRAKYPTEANSHRAMLSRQKAGALVAPSLVLFRDFLRHIGPCPKSGYTIDRLNNADPEYAPDKIGWRSKSDQTRNRSNTVFLTDSQGTTRSLAEWATLTKQSRHTLYARKRRGWSDVAVILGSALTPSAPSTSIWPKGREVQWEAAYGRGAWTLPIGRRELRAEFLQRICRTRYQELMEIVEGIVPPGVEADLEQDELFKKVDGWSRELRRATALLAQPGYRKPRSGGAHA